MQTFATILDNPGEMPHATRYRDPAALRQLGYTDLVIYPTTGLSGLLGPDSVPASENRQWVEDQYESVQRTADDARRAGMKVWLTFDAPSLARELVGSAMTCVRQRDVLCPASNELLEMAGQCLETLLGRLDPAEGVVLRLGDNDAHRLPYLIGNDIYAPHCARCSGMSKEQRLGRFIRYFYDLVVTRLGRRLIARAWNHRPGGMHDDPDLCRRVVADLPEDDRLLLSFKFTQTDFWRYQRWNPSSLACGTRPIIYELECQREFEGKGAIPNYQPPLWRDGMPETAGATGLAQLAGQVNLAGLWAWVRGGGWRGPYVKPESEFWIDANVVAVPALAADPRADLDTLARDWIRTRLNCQDPAATETLLQVLFNSPQTILESFYIGSYARLRHNPWYPSGDFIQDDMVDAEAASQILRGLPETMLDEAVNEKQHAAERISRDLLALEQVAGNLDPALARSMINTLEYGETLIQTLRDLLAGLVAQRRWQRKADANLANTAIQRLRACQTHWNHHVGRVASAKGTASAFSSDNLWELTQQAIDEMAGLK